MVQREERNGGSAASLYKEAKELGFHDMSSNVAEWSGDKANGPFRGIRERAWYGAASNCAVNHTNFGSADLIYDFIGFRTAQGGKIQVNAASSQLVFFYKTCSTKRKKPARPTMPNFKAAWHRSILPPNILGLHPDSLTLANGTPTTSGSFFFSVLAEDSNPSLRSSTEQSFTLEIDSYGLEISSAPSMISSKIQDPVAFATTGGEPLLKWAAPDGLPRGLSLDAATGLLSGTPSRPENASTTIRVADSKGFPATRLVPISITTEPLQISHTPPPSAMNRVDFRWQLEAKGGMAPYKFALAPESRLPSGLYLSI